MDTKQREVLLKVLLDGSPRAPALVQMLTEDIDAMEPTLDDWLQQAEHRGRFQGILETLAARDTVRQDAPADVVSHFHPCTVCGDAVECWCPYPDNAEDGYSTCQRHAEYLPF